MKVRLDQAALNRVARGPIGRAAARKAADGVADAARGDGIRVGDLNRDGVGVEIDLPVEVRSEGEGSSVVLAHPAGVAVQAKHGTLTRAASANGLKVRG